MSEKYDYDVIIIGAGIGGLVCGCYLAKAGLKTLIVEKNAKPGGYCTSFSRKGYHFDACVHALSSLRENGLLNKILTELGVINRLKFNRHDPSDIIITPEFKIKMFHNLNKIIAEFQKYFPEEKIQLDKFFRYIALSESFFDKRSLTFDELLDSFFQDENIKSILSNIIYLTVGCPTDKISAVVACLLYKEFVFDGGYYPVGGLQHFSDTIAERFVELGGDILFSKPVTKIKVTSNKVRGIFCNGGQYFSCKYVVSACDLKQTYFELIGKNKINSNVIKEISKSVPSNSGFIVYLGINKKLIINEELKSNIYLIMDLNARNIYSKVKKCKNDFLGLHTPSAWDNSLNKGQKESICLATNAYFENTHFWNEKRRKEFMCRMVKLAEKAIPGLSGSISLSITATPRTLYKWTRNFKGAAYGLASVPDQFGNPSFSQKTEIENLFLTGHWSNQSSGVSFVASNGRVTADLILHTTNLKH